MNRDYRSRILANDLDSMIVRIEDLGAHPRYTDALYHVEEAKKAIQQGTNDLHSKEMAERFAEYDRSY